MSEFKVSSTFTSGGVAGTPEKKGNVPSQKDKVNCILENLDKKAGFTKGDVVELGKMNKGERADALRLDANIYDVRVDSANGIVNILKKGVSWLRREVNNVNSNVTPKVSNTASSLTQSEKAPVATGNIMKNGGKIIQGSRTFCYNPGGKLAGIIEKQSDGKEKIMDANGKTLYYVLDETQDGEGFTTYYDKSGSPKYGTYWDGISKTYTLEILDNQGLTVKRYTDMMFDYEERDGYDTDYSDDDYDKDENVRFNNSKFGELHVYNREEDWRYFDPVK